MRLTFEYPYRTEEVETKSVDEARKLVLKHRLQKVRRITKDGETVWVSRMIRS